MLTKAQLKQRQDAGKARAKQFTSASQKHARSFVKRESLSNAGKNGWKTMLKSGRIAMVQSFMSARNQLKASSHHVEMREWLKANYTYLSVQECVFPFSERMFEVDFIIEGKFALEVDGFRFKARPFGDSTRDRRAEFRTKLNALHKGNYQVFVFDVRCKEKEYRRLARRLDKFMKERMEFDPLPF